MGPISTLILLPLRPASLTHRSPQRRTRCSCRISCSCDFCGCCLTTHISFSLRCALQKNIFYGPKRLKNFQFRTWNCFFELGLNGSGVGLTHDLFTRLVPWLTTTICNKITVSGVIFMALSCIVLIALGYVCTIPERAYVSTQERLW